MKSLYKYFIIVTTVTIFISCGDQPLVDEYFPIANSNWSYDKPVKQIVDITDNSIPYNIYINFRHTEEYKYSNIWVRITSIGPDNKKKVSREEFQLAMPNGEWIGKGSGNLYSYRLIYSERMKFDTTGKYTFIIEQNMRDNPLKAITDVGLRIEAAQ